MGGSFNTIGKNNDLIKELQNMENGDISTIISSRSNVFVVKLNNKDQLNEIEYSEIKDSLKQAILTRTKGQIYNQWMGSEKDRIEVKDLRSKIF